MDTQQEIVLGVTTISTPSDREIVNERVFNAPRERVFAAYIDPDLLARWWGPRGTTTTVEQLDPRPGGVWRFVVRDDADGRLNAFKGVFREVSPPERIAQTFEWEGLPGHVVLEAATFEDLGEGRTRVRGTSLFHTSEERDGMLASGMEKGLGESHDRLADLLAD
ncbi:MAG TPA: SRPBCC family protein [Solirubrobacteraceae bacterium]|nr:SRPBCC family protein [Solirubrobacteraceae bacterium]